MWGHGVCVHVTRGCMRAAIIRRNPESILCPLRLNVLFSRSIVTSETEHFNIVTIHFLDVVLAAHHTDYHH